MREWTEKHIRELIDDEYRRIKVDNGYVSTAGISQIDGFINSKTPTIIDNPDWLVNNFTIVDENDEYVTIESVMRAQNEPFYYLLNNQRVMAYFSVIKVADESDTNVALPISFDSSLVTDERLRDVYMWQDEKKYALSRYKSVTGDNVKIPGLTSSIGGDVEITISKTDNHIYCALNYEGYENWDNYDFKRHYDHTNPYYSERVIRFEVLK